MKGIVEYIGSRTVLEFKANRSTGSHRSLTDKDIRKLRVGDKLFLKSDISEFRTDANGNPIAGKLVIFPQMVQELGRLVTVTNIDIDSSGDETYISFKGSNFTWPIEIFELPEP